MTELHVTLALWYASGWAAFPLFNYSSRVEMGEDKPPFLWAYIGVFAWSGPLLVLAGLLNFLFIYPPRYRLALTPLQPIRAPCRCKTTYKPYFSDRDFVTLSSSFDKGHSMSEENNSKATQELIAQAKNKATQEGFEMCGYFLSLAEQSLSGDTTEIDKFMRDKAPTHKAVFD